MEEHRRRYSLLRQGLERIGDMQIPVYGANAGFFLSLSVFPLLLILLSMVPYLPYSANDLLQLMQGVVPSALMGTVESLIVNIYYNSSGAVLGLSAVVALWSASRGIYAILTGLNHIYGVLEDRGYMLTRVLSVVYTFVLILLLVLTLVMQVIFPAAEGWFGWLETPLMDLIGKLLDLRAVWMLLVQIGVFTAMYMMLPNRRNRFWDSLPGAAVAAVGWQGLTWGFSFYVERMGLGVNIYGSVYTLALGMLWMYWCMCILLFGGGVNRLVQQWQHK